MRSVISAASIFQHGRARDQAKARPYRETWRRYAAQLVELTASAVVYWRGSRVKMLHRQESTPGTKIRSATRAMTIPKETLQEGLGNSLLTNVALSIITATVAT